jgi:hypothetical protein
MQTSYTGEKTMRKYIVFLTFLLTAFAAACSTTEPLTSVGDIRGKKWRLQAFDSPEQGRVSVPEPRTQTNNAGGDPRYEVQFSDTTNKFGIYWNCNFGGGVFAIQPPNVLRMDSAFTTQRGCENTQYDDKMLSGDDRQSLMGWLFASDCTYNSDENRLRIWYDNNTKSADFVRIR